MVSLDPARTDTPPRTSPEGQCTLLGTKTVPNAPTLPTGYYGCFWLAVVPPLWRRMVDGRIPSEIRNSDVD